MKEFEDAMEDEKRHINCRNFAPVDAAKGICRHTLDITNADTPSCEKYELLPRCMNCSKYSEGEGSYLGMCNEADAAHFTYPDLPAVTCPWYRKR